MLKAGYLGGGVVNLGDRGREWGREDNRLNIISNNSGRKHFEVMG